MASDELLRKALLAAVEGERVLYGLANRRKALLAYKRAEKLAAKMDLNPVCDRDLLEIRTATGKVMFSILDR